MFLIESINDKYLCSIEPLFDYSPNMKVQQDDVVVNVNSAGIRARFICRETVRENVVRIFSEKTKSTKTF